MHRIIPIGKLKMKIIPLLLLLFSDESSIEMQGMRDGNEKGGKVTFVNFA